MKKYLTIGSCLILICVLSGSHCSKNSAGLHDTVRDYEVFQTEVAELSGMCFGPDQSTFYAVSDQGGIYELYPDGSTKRKFAYRGSSDFEAICLNPTDGRICLADEANMNIVLLSADELTVSTITHINVPGGIANKGLEGLSAANDTLYILNQESPAVLIRYALLSNTEAARVSVPFASYLSDIFFDGSDHTIWICDSKQQRIFHCQRNGELIAYQDIDFVPKAEALVIDRPHNIAWVGCDQTGKLFRIKLKI
jgi:hypothetical protein